MRPKFRLTGNVAVPDNKYPLEALWTAGGDITLFRKVFATESRVMQHTNNTAARISVKALCSEKQFLFLVRHKISFPFSNEKSRSESGSGFVLT